MKKLLVKTKSSGYDIVIGDGLMVNTGEYILPYAGADNAIVAVTDENVWRLYRDMFTASMKAAGLNVSAVVLDAGERNKSMEGLGSLYDFFAKAKLGRGGLVIALGGGVIGDLAGFAASTWMRGVRYIQIPTSLLAQVDSSVGGKTAINLPSGKNMAGTFYQPKTVIIDPLTLKTLPEREIRCGMAEVIKYGAIRSAKLFDALNSGNDINYADIIGECCQIKADIVGRDELDTGERMILNFGHTFGHAIEKRYEFERFNHGEAVAIGMIAASLLGEEMGVTAPETASRLMAALELHGLDCSLPCPLNELLSAMELDKKSEGDGVRMVFLRDIGESFYRRVSFGEIGGMLERVEERWKTVKQ